MHMGNHCIPSAHLDRNQGGWANVETVEPVMVESTQVRVGDEEAGDVARC